MRIGRRERNADNAAIMVKGDDRCCFFGATGSGKTTLIRSMLRDVGRFAVLDPKHDFRMNGVPVTSHYDSHKAQQIIRVPLDKGELANWSSAMLALWEHGDTIVVVDETTLINPSNRLLPELGRLVRTGRSRGIGTWIGSQRPKDIPSALFTESEHFFIFRLQWEADRKKCADFTGDRILPVLRDISSHDLVYYGVRDDMLLTLRPTLRSRA